MAIRHFRWAAKQIPVVRVPCLEQNPRVSSTELRGQRPVNGLDPAVTHRSGEVRSRSAVGVDSLGFLVCAFPPEACTLRWPVPRGDFGVDPATSGRRARLWNAALPSGDRALRHESHERAFPRGWVGGML